MIITGLFFFKRSLVISPLSDFKSVTGGTEGKRLNPAEVSSCAITMKLVNKTAATTKKLFTIVVWIKSKGNHK